MIKLLFLLGHSERDACFQMHACWLSTSIFVLCAASLFGGCWLFYTLGDASRAQFS